MLLYLFKSLSWNKKHQLNYNILQSRRRRESEGGRSVQANSYQNESRAALGRKPTS